MMNFILTNMILAMILVAAIPCPANGGEKQTMKHLSSPNWVHPAERASYPGYDQLEQDKKTGEDWQYSTNRARGNIRGGGTTAYTDYRPLYSAPKPEQKK